MDFHANNIRTMACRAHCFESAVPLREVTVVARMVCPGRKAVNDGPWLVQSWDEKGAA